MKDPQLIKFTKYFAKTHEVTIDELTQCAVTEKLNKMFSTKWKSYNGLLVPFAIYYVANIQTGNIEIVFCITKPYPIWAN